MDSGARWATVPGVAKSRTRLSNWACTQGLTTFLVYHFKGEQNPPNCLNSWSQVVAEPRLGLRIADSLWPLIVTGHWF